MCTWSWWNSGWSGWTLLLLFFLSPLVAATPTSAEGLPVGQEGHNHVFFSGWECAGVLWLQLFPLFWSVGWEEGGWSALVLLACLHAHAHRTRLSIFLIDREMSQLRKQTELVELLSSEFRVNEKVWNPLSQFPHLWNASNDVIEVVITTTTIAFLPAAQDYCRNKMW